MSGTGLTQDQITQMLGTPQAQSLMKSSGLGSASGATNTLGTGTTPTVPASTPTTVNAGNGRLASGVGTANTGGTPFENSGGTGTLGGGSAPTTAPTGAAPLPPVPSFSSPLGSGATFTPTPNALAGATQAYAQNGANGIAPPPSNFARWQTYQPFQGLNTKTVPLGGGAGYTSAPGGTTPPPNTGTPNTGTTAPPTTTPPVTQPPNPNGSLTPGTVPSDRGVPPGGNGTPTAPITLPTGQNLGDQLNQYFQKNLGASNLSNGNFTMSGFQFSPQAAAADPMLAQFNQLQAAGKTDTAYSLLGSNALGTNALQAAWNGDPSTMNQIINTFRPGGTDVYFGQQNQYDPTAASAYGQFFNGEWLPAGVSANNKSVKAYNAAQAAAAPAAGGSK